MRIVRAGVGVLVVVFALGVLVTAGGTALLASRRGADGGFTATTQRIHTPGYALVVADLDTLLRTEAPFARGGQSVLDLSLAGPGGPLFVGLGAPEAVDRYLADSPVARVDRVRLARGPLPVDLSPVAGTGQPPTAPIAQGFWIATSTGLLRDGRAEDPLSWSPTALRNRPLSLVIMNANGAAGLDVTVRATLTVGWLVPTSVALTVFGGVSLLLGAVLLAWPARREFIYPTDREDARSVVADLAEVPGPRRGIRPPGEPRRWRSAGPPPATPRLLWPPAVQRPTALPVPVGRPGAPVNAARIRPGHGDAERNSEPRWVS